MSRCAAPLDCELWFPLRGTLTGWSQTWTPVTMTAVPAGPAIQWSTPASCFGCIPVTSPLLILLHDCRDRHPVKSLTEDLGGGLAKGLQNKWRMNSFQEPPRMPKYGDAAPSVPVHVGLGRYAGGGP